MEGVFPFFLYKEGKYVIYDYLKPMTTQIIHELPNRVNTPLILIPRMGQVAWLSIFWL